MRKAALFLIMTLLISPIAAAELQRFGLPNTQVHIIKSDFSEIDYEIRVWLTQDYKDDERTYPTIIMLDADYSFPLVTSVAGHLAQRGQATDSVIVAIGYSNSAGNAYWYRRNRTRDYTPTKVLEGGYGPEIQKFSGGAPAFLKFIREQLVPFLNSTFRVSGGDRVFIGHSFGGLFGAYILAEDPDLFRRYILVSPSLWYDDHLMLDPARLDRLAAVRDTRDIFLAVGAYENQSGERMIDDLDKYVSLIRRAENPKLVVQKRIFDGETHASIFPTAVSTGLRYFSSLENDD